MSKDKEECLNEDVYFRKSHIVTCRYCGIKFKAPSYRTPKYCSRAHYLKEIHPHFEAQPKACPPKKEEPSKPAKVEPKVRKPKKRILRTDYIRVKLIPCPTPAAPAPEPKPVCPEVKPFTPIAESNCPAPKPKRRKRFFIFRIFCWK